MSSTAIVSSNGNEEKQLIVSSPYPNHLLDVTRLDKSAHEVAVVLQNLRPNEGYLDLPYEQAFNWSDVFSNLSNNFEAANFYVVVFRSQLAVSSVGSPILIELYSLDEQAHCEANKSGGLLKYWFGTPSGDRRNLATCIWTGRDCALKAYGLPAHAKAMKIVCNGVYEHWIIEKFNLSIQDCNHWTFNKSK